MMNLVTDPTSSRALAKAKPTLIKIHGLEWWDELVKEAETAESVEDLPEQFRAALRGIMSP
jgi:hypothetical protein